MTDPSVVHNTFVIERDYRASPDRVFAAFSTAERKRRWFAESDGHEVEQFELNFEVGGSERARYRFKEGTHFPGVVFGTDTVFTDIVPSRRIVFASTTILGDRRISASLVTVELTASGPGTKLVFTHQAAFFENSDGPQMREQGWRHILERLVIELAR